MAVVISRDAAVVAAVLRLVVALRRANIGETYPDAAEALRIWNLSDIVEADRDKRRELVDARLESIVAAIEEQPAATA